MKRRNPYQLNTEKPADRIADLWRDIDSELRGISQCQKDFQREIMTRQKRVDSLIQQFAALLTSQQGQETLNIPTFSPQYIPGKQKFGWNGEYNMEKLHVRINTILIEDISFRNLELAFTGVGEPEQQIVIRNHKQKEFVDLIYFLFVNGITFNDEHTQAILDRCLYRNRKINKESVIRCVSLSRTAHSSRLAEPLFDSTSKIISHLKRAKLRFD